MKKIVPFFLLLILTSCVGNFIGNSGLQLNNKSHAWHIRNTDNNIVTLTSQTFPDVYVRLDLRNILYNAGLSQSACYDKVNAGGINVVYPLVLYVGHTNNSAQKKMLYALNPTKSYFMKNNIKYPLEIVNIFNLKSVPQNQYYDYSRDFQKNGCVAKSFSSPLVCGELEQAVLVIDGIKINNKLLSPIELQLNFEKPQTIPLYGQ